MNPSARSTLPVGGCSSVQGHPHRPQVEDVKSVFVAFEQDFISKPCAYVIAESTDIAPGQRVVMGAIPVTNRHNLRSAMLESS